jgi:RHH-type rel operon transcriptional repressor/antitoxin RelB
MLALRLPENVEHRLELLSKRTGRTKSYYAKVAIEEFLEDREDYLLAVQRLAEKNPRISLTKVRRLLELED